MKDKKRKAPIRKNPHERLTVKGLTLEAKIKYHILTCKTRVSAKLVRIKQKSPTLPTTYPTWNAELRKSGGFLYVQHFINAFQPVAYRCPAVMCLCCNVRQREPLNVPQKSNLSVYPPKRCGFDGGNHLLSVKSLQRNGQHYTSRRHRQHRARRAAAAVRRCAP